MTVKVYRIPLTQLLSKVTNWAIRTPQNTQEKSTLVPRLRGHRSNHGKLVVIGKRGESKREGLVIAADWSLGD